MKVILLKDVKSLGKEGDVVEVSDGHAMNFLFPQNLGVQATAETLARRTQKEEKAKKMAKREVSASSKSAKALEGVELVMKEKVSEGGTLYAAVNAAAIAKALKKKTKVDVAADMVEVEGGPIKEPGERRVTVNLPHGFEANLTVRVDAA
jgi:large subunit ribosomal protein L9